MFVSAIYLVILSLYLTSGPLEETAGAFWRMVWEQRSSTIVMLTSLEERGRVSVTSHCTESEISNILAVLL